MGPGLKLHPAIVVVALPVAIGVWSAGGAPLGMIVLASAIILAVTFPKLAKRSAKVGGKLALKSAKLAGRGAKAAYVAHRNRKVTAPPTSRLKGRPTLRIVP